MGKNFNTLDEQLKRMKTLMYETDSLVKNGTPLNEQETTGDANSGEEQSSPTWTNPGAKVKQRTSLLGNEKVKIKQPGQKGRLKINKIKGGLERLVKSGTLGTKKLNMDIYQIKGHGEYFNFLDSMGKLTQQGCVEIKNLLKQYFNTDLGENQCPQIIDGKDKTLVDMSGGLRSDKDKLIFAVYTGSAAATPTNQPTNTNATASTAKIKTNVNADGTSTSKASL